LALALAVLAVIAAGLTEVRWWAVREDVIVRLPFGPGANDPGKAVGLDDVQYGPLGFAVGGRRLVVADTYHERLLWRPLGRPRDWHAVPVPHAILEGICYQASSASFYLADNRTLTILRLHDSHIVPWRHVPEPSGATASLWQMAAGPRDLLYVEEVAFGHGRFRLELLELGGDRRARTLAVTEAGQDWSLTPTAAGGVLNVPVHNFQVGPDGVLYIEAPSLSASEREILRYDPSGKLIGTVTVAAPGTIDDTALLGVDSAGRIYFGVNLGDPRQAGLVLVLSSGGHVLVRIPVPPTTVQAAQYGWVAPNGTLYLNESTGEVFRLVAFRLVVRSRVVWRL
jgi:hypothetical protein